MNSYRKLADLCDKLSDAFLGKEVDPQPNITISEDGRHVTVVWDAWNDVDGDVRYDMVTEAYYQAFGTEKGLMLRTARGHTVKEDEYLKK